MPRLMNPLKKRLLLGGEVFWAFRYLEWEVQPVQVRLQVPIQVALFHVRKHADYFVRV